MEWKLNEMTSFDYLGVFMTRLMSAAKSDAARTLYYELYEIACSTLDLAVHHPLMLCFKESDVALAIVSSSYNNLAMSYNLVDEESLLSTIHDCQVWIEMIEKCPGLVSISHNIDIEPHIVAASNEKAVSFILSIISTSIK